MAKFNVIAGMSDASQVEDGALRDRLMQAQVDLARLDKAIGSASQVQEVKGVEEYDDSLLLKKLKELGLTADSIEGRLYLLEMEVKKLKRWWREWPISFRVAFATGDAIMSGSSQLRVNAGSISLSGVMHYSETTLIDLDTVVDPLIKRSVLYYRLKSDGSDGWTPETGEFVAATIDESHPYLMPETTVLRSGSSITCFEYWFPIAILEQGWDDTAAPGEEGDGMWVIRQVKIGLLTVEATLANYARVVAAQTTSGEPTSYVCFAGGLFIAQGTTTIPVSMISISSSCVLYLEVTPDGTDSYSFAFQQTAGIDTMPVDEEGYARIPIARVLVEDGKVRDVYNLRRGGPIPLQGKVP
jgi:hypothetical protein